MIVNKHTNEIVRILMERDKMSELDAIEVVEQLRQDIVNGTDIEDVLDELGLEPDYIFDLI